MTDQRVCRFSSGAMARSSGSSAPPRRKDSSFSRTAADSSVESGLRPPPQRGTVPLLDFARRTYAVISRTRASSSTRPENTNRLPGASFEMNDSSIVPSDFPPPLAQRTVIALSDVIVPMATRWFIVTERSRTT